MSDVNVERTVLETYTVNPAVVEALTPTLQMAVENVMTIINGLPGVELPADLVVRTEVAHRLGYSLMSATELGGSLVRHLDDEPELSREELPEGFDKDSVQSIVDDLKSRGGQDEAYGSYLRDAINDLLKRAASGHIAQQSLKELVLLVDEQDKSRREQPE